MKIPIYDAYIDENDIEGGLTCISIVDCPAMEKEMLVFNQQHRPMMFKVENEMEHCITSVVIRADFPVYRYDSNIGEYYIRFSKDLIKQLTEKYSKDGLLNQVSVQHNGVLLEDITMVQYFIKDIEKGINPTGFEDIEDGSLFATFKINNDEVWQQIMAGEYGGLSMELLCDIKPTEEFVEEPDIDNDDFADFIASLLSALEDEDCEIIFDSDKDKWLVNGDGEYWLDENGNKVPAKCPKCGADVGVYIKGEPVFLCSECGEYLGTVKFPDDEMFSVEVKKKIKLNSDDEEDEDGLWSLNFEVERTDVAKAIDQKKTVLIDGKEKWVHSLGKSGENDIVVLYDPKNGKWETKNIKDIETWEPTKTTIGEFPEVPSSITDNDDITIQRNVNTGSYSDLIHNRVPVMISYDDEQPQPHTGYRTCYIVAYGYTKRNNECIRVFQQNGDSRSASEGELPLPSYRLMLARRCKGFKPMQGVEKYPLSVLDTSILNWNGDRSMEPCVDHIKESDFN